MKRSIITLCLFAVTGCAPQHVSNSYAKDVCSERDDPAACLRAARQPPWTPAMQARAERDEAYANRQSLLRCGPDGANDWDDRTGPVCEVTK